MTQDKAQENDGVRGLTRVLAEDLNETPEEIEREAARMKMGPPWEAEFEYADEE